MRISDWSSDVCSSDLRRFNRENIRPETGLEGPEAAGAAHAIVIGYGRFGQTVAQMLTAQGASVTLIDSNPVQIERTASFGRKVYYGDGRRVALLRRAGAAEATLLIYCLDVDWLGASGTDTVRPEV